MTVGLDLSREEREFHQVRQGLVLLFHSLKRSELCKALSARLMRRSY